ncbi:ATP-binding cassette domain-containing protein [Actinoplanes aureus]|uniref:ATP-binding cassette domain-containing protein n=1 Tax=Actinoplanes aureus TaxID=2792083 RepID=A0A931CF47_9ACTN|nr:ATP-binding cassette domain-containing protein [Actinoplanes aureus]MBG0566063.1 ATP-binding cassette domain-containing protein [Actinoplanes aureus]
MTRLVALLAAVLVAHAGQYGLFLYSWIILGGATFAGELTGTVIAAWAVTMAAGLGCRAVTSHLQSALAVIAGARLRRRLLRGALGLDPAAVRREGTGHLLGRVLETESLEDLATGGALRGLAAAVELVLAAVLLTTALGPAVPVLLTGWLVAAAVATARYTRRRMAWTTARLALGNDLAEKIAGHRTRAVQQDPEHRHDGERAALDAYTSLAASMDRGLTVLTVLIPRGWALTGTALLAASVAAGAAAPARAAGALAVMFTYGAMAHLSTGLAGLADARCAWAQLGPLLPVTTNEPPADAAVPETVTIKANGVGFHYPGRAHAALPPIDLRIDAGDRLVLEGPSGSGKSTLAALLAGTLEPTTGRLHLTSTTPGTVLAVPQADHNHLLLGPLAMNVLLGRAWPPEPADLRSAEEVCRAIGLGDLLDRMPAGMAQIIGETGWRLSEGERSLVFLARALLQGAPVLILDETFGALDPHTLDTALNAALDRTSTLVVVRH